MKIDRNALCPCQSGLKFKKCCRMNPDRIEAANSLNAQYIDRDYVFSNLKQRSTKMAQFLDAVPSEIVQLLWIFVNPKLNANMRSLAGFGHFAIIVKQLPIAEENFFDFSHEIGHIILGMMNYPLAEIVSGDMSLVSLVKEIDPRVALLACGDLGRGALATVADIVSAVQANLD